MANGGDETFGRDLGYLEKFFDKLEAHAGSLAPDAGSRLRELIGEERQRWGEIRQLVGASAPEGAAAQAPAKEATAPASEKPEEQAAKETTAGDIVAPLTDPSVMRPYTRAYHLGMAQLAQLKHTPPPAPPASPLPAGARTELGAARSSLTVGSLKPRR